MSGSFLILALQKMDPVFWLLLIGWFPLFQRSLLTC